MTVTPDPENPDLGENLPPAVLALQNAIITFTGCISDALPDICSVGFTLGEGYVPFDPDPDEDCKGTDVECSQAWVRAMNIQPKGGGAVGFGGADCSMTLTLELEVGVLRCLKIPPRAKAPTATDVLVAGMQALTDAQAILCAALACDAWDDTVQVGAWNPSGPLGGQHGGTWTFLVEIS